MLSEDVIPVEATAAACPRPVTSRVWCRSEPTVRRIMVRLQGSHVALVTPLTADRQVHAADLERLIRRAASDGAAGVVLAGSTGEGGLLEPSQRAELAHLGRATADRLDEPLTVIVGAVGSSVDALDRDLAALAATGADGALVLAPSLYPLTSAELVDLHLDVAERAEIPTLVYHLPQLTGSSLVPDALRELAAHPNIVGIKDSSDDVERKLAFVEVAADTGRLALLTGHTDSLLATLTAGAVGSITAVANLRQREVVALHDAVAAGDRDEADRLQAELSRLSTNLKQVGTTHAVVKAALQLQGVIEERWCVPPMHSLPPARLDRVRTALLP